MITITRGDVTLDLMGNQLDSDMRLLKGINVVPIETPALSNITIKNGSASKPGIGIFMPTKNNDRSIRFLHGVDVSNFHGDLDAYPKTAYVLENLTLKGDGQVILMQGRKNIIRNCKIIGGNSAINLMGPDLVFENNEIIFNAKPQVLDRDGPPVALYLEDAGHSVIRNNRIIVLSHDVPDTEAIVLKNSPNVKIEGNSVMGVRSLYKSLDKQSMVVDLGNELHPLVDLVNKVRYSIYRR